MPKTLNQLSLEVEEKIKSVKKELAESDPTDDTRTWLYGYSRGLQFVWNKINEDLIDAQIKREKEGAI